MYITHTYTHPGPIFQSPYLRTSRKSSAGGQKVDVGSIYRRELPEGRRVSFGVGTLLVVEQSGMENRPRGGGWYNIPSHTVY